MYFVFIWSEFSWFSLLSSWRWWMCKDLADGHSGDSLDFCLGCLLPAVWKMEVHICILSIHIFVLLSILNMCFVVPSHPISPSGPALTGALAGATPARALAGAIHAAAHTVASTGAVAATLPCPTADGTSETGYELPVCLTHKQIAIILHFITHTPRSFYITQHAQWKKYLDRPDFALGNGWRFCFLTKLWALLKTRIFTSVKKKLKTKTLFWLD